MDIAMVKFECNSRKKCCASFGEFIKVERQISDHDYLSLAQEQPTTSRISRIKPARDKDTIRQ